MASHSGAVVVLVMMMMMTGGSNCMMGNTSIASSTTASNSTATASSTWCNGHIIHGQCILVADTGYSGEEHLDLDLDMMDLEVVEYYDSGDESSRRILVYGSSKTQVSVDKYKVPFKGKPNMKYQNNCGSPYNRICKR